MAGYPSKFGRLSEVELTVGYLFNARALIKRFSSEGGVNYELYFYWDLIIKWPLILTE